MTTPKYNLTGLQPGDIIFTYEKNSWISELIVKLVRLRGDSEEKKAPDISHIIMYFAEHITVESTYNGIAINPAINYSRAKYKIHVRRVKGITDLQKELIKAQAFPYIGKTPYAYSQLLALFFKKLFGIKKPIGDVDKKHFICSEFVITMYRKIGIDLVPGWNPAETTPMKLFSSKLLEDVNIL